MRLSLFSFNSTATRVARYLAYIALTEYTQENDHFTCFRGA